MTKTPIILALLMAAGCASTEGTAEYVVPTPVYGPSTSSALAFDPPAVIGQPTASFSRDGRSPEAFAGYEDQVTVFSYTRQRDEIRVDHDNGSLHRRAYTDRTSVTTR